MNIKYVTYHYQCKANMSERSDIKMLYEQNCMKHCLFTSRCALHYENNVLDIMIKLCDEVILI